MSTHVDREVLVGFVEEARAYLPNILDCIGALRTAPGQESALREAHRLLHSIKGAASMVGLSVLSHVAYLAEETLDEVAEEQLAMGPDVVETLVWTTGQIESCLDGVTTGRLDEAAVLADVVRRFRRLKGLEESGDEPEIARLSAARTASPASFGASESRDLGENTEPSGGAVEDASAELIDAFRQEAEEHLQQVASLLHSLEQQPERREPLQRVRRSIHTLKGAAGMVGFRSISQLAHRMEDLLDALYDGSFPMTPQVLALLFDTSYGLEDLLGSESGEEPARDRVDGLYAAYSRLLGEPLPAPDGDGDDTETAIAPLALLDDEEPIDLSRFATAGGGTNGLLALDDGAGAARAPSQIVRVPIERLDELVRLVSELVVSRSTFEQYYRGLVHESDELSLSVERLRRIAGRIETDYEVSAFGTNRLAAGRPAAAGRQAPNTYGFDDLEFDRYTEFHLLSRELSETTSDINAVGSEVSNSIGDFDSYLTRAGRLTGEVQDKLMRLRMVPLATLATRLHRTVRVTAAQKAKVVDLAVEGEQIELDKTVLEQIADPLLHLLRNAVDHGIEPPSLRRVLGKPERGSIRLRAYHEAAHVVVQVSDDGAGLSPQLIRSAAVSGGYLSESDAESMSDHDAYALIFQPGFSTTTEVSEVSGRGVGLDIVKASVHKMKGSIAVDSTPGAGTTFTVRLPMTLAIVRVLLVRANGEIFAVPLAAVTQILRLERDELERIGQEPVVRVDGTVHPVIHLAAALGLKQQADDTVRKTPVLILNLGDTRVACVVDHIVEARDVVVKSMGALLRRVHGVSGATLMGDGSVVLILNPAELVHDAPVRQAPVGRAVRAARAPQSRGVLDVLVVDDSVSVRRVLSNSIRSAGWNPLTAKDGLEALELLQSSPKIPDVVLLDIEMPRMDGYELTATLRAQAAFAGLPIVMLTSRAGEAHKRKALDLGVSEYLVKPYQDDVLIDTIRRLALAQGAAPS